jgi:predicted metal-dependent hydrolase
MEISILLVVLFIFILLSLLRRGSTFTPNEISAIEELEQRNRVLLKHLQTSANDPAMERLVHKYQTRSPKLTNSLEKTGYTINKGESIGVCLKDVNEVRNNKTKSEIMDQLYFVVLHELAHVCTVSWGHTQEFWENFRKLRKHAFEAGVWKAISDDSMICGERLT